MRNTLKMKRIARIANISLLMSASAIATEAEKEFVFNDEFNMSCGTNMEHVVDDVSAQGALYLLRTWVTSSNPSIKQRTFEAAEALIKKWELQPPGWLPSILPIAAETFTKLYEALEHPSEENPGLAKAQKNFKQSLEEVALQAREGKLPALLSEETIEKLRQSKAETQKQDKDKEERQTQQREQARKELDKKSETQQHVQELRQEQQEQAKPTAKGFVEKAEGFIKAAVDKTEELVETTADKVKGFLGLKNTEGDEEENRESGV
jgi:hypothetical protein